MLLFCGGTKSWSWDKVCKPKKEGGLGIRRLEDLCTATGLKLVWRCCTTETIWAKWMKQHYVGDNHFWQAQVSLLDSGSWKFLLGSKDLAAANMRRVICNGEGTSLWFDPWLSEGRLVDMLGADTISLISSPNLTVSKLIVDGRWQMTIPALAPYWPEILSIPLLNLDSGDYWVWKGNSKGT